MAADDIVKFFDGEFYLGVFLGCLLLVLLAEIWRPRRAVSHPMMGRWCCNFALYFLNLLVIFVIFPMTSVAAAFYARSSGIGLCNWLPLPGVVAFITALLLIDLAKYLQHYALHRVPLLWRLHRPHHSDDSCDVTTSLRFHPLEAIVSEVVQIAVILLVGAPPVAVACYRVFRIAVSTIVHGNIGYPERVEYLLRRVIITPDLHRVHHSRDARESNSNFSGGLICWDLLFGTYREQPGLGHEGMRLGIKGYDAARAASLGRILVDPFETPAGES